MFGNLNLVTAGKAAGGTGPLAIAGVIGKSNQHVTQGATGVNIKGPFRGSYHQQYC